MCRWRHSITALDKSSSNRYLPTRLRPFAGGIDSADVLSPSPQRVWVIKEAIVATTSSVVSVELVHIDDPLNHTERGAIAGFLAGYTGNTLVSYTTISACSLSGATRTTPHSSTHAGHISKSSVEPWKPTAACDLRSRVVFQRLAVSTGTATSKESWNATPPRMFDAPKLMSSHAPSV
jgi:hypothetical protein